MKKECQCIKSEHGNADYCIKSEHLTQNYVLGEIGKHYLMDAIDSFVVPMNFLYRFNADTVVL